MQHDVSMPDVPDRDNSPSTPSQSEPPSRHPNFGRIALIAVLVLLVIASGTIGVVAFLKNNAPSQSTQTGNAALASNATGSVSFSDSQNGSGHSDVVAISVNGLAAPPDGFRYDAWIVDTQSKRTIVLGTLALNKDGSYTVTFAEAGTNLLSTGDKVEITLEKGTVNVPTGQVILSAAYPPKALLYIKHLLVSFSNTPGNIGLLVGLVGQSQKLNDASKMLQSIAVSRNSIAIECATQSIIDIAEGAQGPHYKPLASQCGSQNITEAGDGYGLQGANGYIANGETQTSLASTQPDATDSIHAHARHVAISLENMKGWIATIDQDALSLLNNPANTTKVQEIVTLSNHALNGVDTNSDGSIDPVPGEGAATTAYYHAQLMVVLILAPGS